MLDQVACADDADNGRRAGQAGQAVPAYLVAVAISLVFFVLLVQFVVWQYGRGAVRAALDEAVLMSASTIVVALNAQLLRRVDLRPLATGAPVDGPTALDRPSPVMTSI